MAKKGLVLRKREIRKMLKSDEIAEVCEEEAKAIQATAQAISGEEYGIRKVKLKTRVGYNVYPESKEAKKDNFENNTLMKSVN